MLRWCGLLVVMSAFGAKGQYVLEWSPRLIAAPTSSQDATLYSLLPEFVLLDDSGAVVPDPVELSSPTGRYKYFREGDERSGFAFPETTTEAVVDEANGEWRLFVLDGFAPMYEYAISVTMAPPPFAPAESVSIESSSLVDGGSTDDIAWHLDGGSVDYPGPSAGFLVTPRDAATFSSLEEQQLPITATSWTPGVPLTGGAEYSVTVRTVNEAEDPSSLQVISATPVTPGAPSLTIEPFALRYTTQRRARLTAPCPADVNGDGLVTPADFNAWVLAFNSSAPECDQNGDQLCSPADFNAWILNFNADC